MSNLVKQPFVFRPIFYNLKSIEEKANYIQLINSKKVNCLDTIQDQLKELIKLRNPTKKLTTVDYTLEIDCLLNGQSLEEYGIWVYYPWNNCLVHTLAEDEFIEVRTSRNQYKITKEERDLLAQKTIGIIGLSVGQSIAITLAIERVCGTLKLADFDTLELSNLNRIRSGIHNLGIPKVIITAREIAEIDPYLTIQLFPDGLTDENIDEFFGTEKSVLDILIDVCDGLDMKIVSRYKAKKLGIPVVMDTNDRGMLDIERFDLEPNREILHGLAGDLNPTIIKDLTNEEKIPYILKMVGAESISPRLKASMMEIEQTLNTWPQLASSVQLGGAITTDVCRRILLNQLHVSGRFYIDLDQLISDPQLPVSLSSNSNTNPFEPLNELSIKTLATAYFNATKTSLNNYQPNENQLSSIIDAAIAAPSAGNNQPWKWFYENGRLLLLHDRFRSWSWGDYAEMGSHMSLGTAIESVSIQSALYGLGTHVTYINQEQNLFLVAEINFYHINNQNPKQERYIKLAKNLTTRHTNRKSGNGKPIDRFIIDEMKSQFNIEHGFQFNYIEDKKQLAELGEIIAACDRIRLLYEKGHEEFFHEVRWNKEHALQTKDGIDIRSVDLNQSEIAGFSMAKDYKAIQYLNEWNLGNGFKKISIKSMNTASGFGIISIQEFNRLNLIELGNDILRSWIIANKHDVSFYPMLSPAFFFNRLIHGKGIGIPDKYIEELTNLNAQFKNSFDIHNYPAFMFRLSISAEKSIKTERLNKELVYVS